MSFLNNCHRRLFIVQLDKEIYWYNNEIIEWKGYIRIDFENIWPDFNKYPFAVYNQEKVFLDKEVIDRDNRFIGNTSIDFEGKELAIWYIEDENNRDIELLISKFDYPKIDEKYQIRYMEANKLINILDRLIEIHKAI